MGQPLRFGETPASGETENVRDSPVRTYARLENALLSHSNPDVVNCTSEASGLTRSSLRHPFPFVAARCERTFSRYRFAMNYFTSVPDTGKFIARRLRARERGCDPRRYEGVAQKPTPARISEARVKRRKWGPLFVTSHLWPVEDLDSSRGRKRGAGERSCLTPLPAAAVDLAPL